MFRLLLASLCVTSAACAASTLDRVKSSHHLRCGIIAEQTDFEWQDTHGNLAPFAADMCRALAASVLGDTAGLQLRGFPDAPHGLQAVHDGSLDVLYGVTPRAEWSLHYGVAFAQPVFFDGLTVMVSVSSGAKTVADLADKPVCFIGNTFTESRIRHAFEQRKISLRPFPFQENGEMEAALVTGHCAAEAADASALAEARTGFHARQASYTILPELLSLDPYAPALPANDTAWQRVVDAAGATLVAAEMDGVTKADVASRVRSASTLPLLQAEGSGAPYGLADGWRLAELAEAGNYGEIFEHDLGSHSPLRLVRGPNRPWSFGGLMWAPPAD